MGDDRWVTDNRLSSRFTRNISALCCCAAVDIKMPASYTLMHEAHDDGFGT